MASSEKVTIDRAYYDALLRRADFHTSAQLFGRPDPANVVISRVEYDSLLRTAREFKLLKSALFQGGITAESLDLLIAGADGSDHRKDSGIEMDPNSHDVTGQTPPTVDSFSQPNVASHFHDVPWRTGGSATFELAPETEQYQNGGLHGQSGHLRVPELHRHASYGMQSSIYDDRDLDMGASDVGETNVGSRTVSGGNEKRTLYFSGFSDSTTYRDLLSVIKGGKLLSINMRSERSATVSFSEGAADFLTWAKRNDIYLHAKRVDVKWADRQFRLNTHIANKIANGATRNILIRSALDKGLTESQIRDDMEHVHNLFIIDVVFRGSDAYVSTNSIHNALFARTCMMSRSTYKGCKIEFIRDECDVPLPTRFSAPKATGAGKKAWRAAPAIRNRFDMLNIDGADRSSDEENRMPSGDDDNTVDTTSHAGVNLNFLDSDSV